MAVVFVDTGTEIVSDAILGIAGAGGPATATGFYIHWGTGGGTVTATNTDIDLAQPATEVRVSATSETQPSADTTQWVGRLTNQKAGGVTISEAGLFIDATGTATDMLIRGDHADVGLATEDIIEYTITLQMT